MTNWELAQAMVRLGAVTASALDAGGSTTMAFDGKLLNRPSDPGGERSVGGVAGVLYTGVYAPPPTLPVVSPNGDGVGRAPALSVQGRSSPRAVTASSARPGRRDRLHRDRLAPARHLHLRVALDRQTRGRSEPLGRWRWVISATDTDRPDLVGRALLLAERHARLHDRRAALGAAAARRRARRSSPASSWPPRPA